ncbi:hypothetical protein JWG43_06615 [Desulfobulbus alkaliphilus]|nr:hypothetical protein [Desulfobulbus alkaliphilus]
MLKEKNLSIAQVSDARKEALAGDDAWMLLAKAKEIHVARGKKQRIFDPQADDKDEILAQTLGRSGTLRAPTLRIGDRLLVGFNEALYALL